MRDIKLKSLVVDGHEMFYRDDILENPNPLKDDMIAFYHGVKDLYQVKRNSLYGQIIFKKLGELDIPKVNSHDTLTARAAELEALIAEASDYLTENRLSSIGSGSILHTKFKEALLINSPGDKS